MVSKDEHYYLENWKHINNVVSDKDLLTAEQKTNLDAMLESPDKENFVLAEELLRLKLQDVLVEGLNDGQAKAFINIIDYFNDNDDTDFDALVLKGYAGTGKTYLIKRILQYINSSYPNRKVAISAPTNKAVHVIAEDSIFGDAEIFESYGNSKERLVYATVHKLMSLKEIIDFDGNVTFGSDGKSDITRFQYFFLDEVSMLNDKLFDNLMTFKDKIKIVFMGDPCQVPPVGKKYTKALKENSGFKIKTVSLTEIMRQKQNHPVVKASMILRKSLLSSYGLADLKTEINSDGKLILINGKTERERLRPIIKKYFTSSEQETNGNHVKIIAWTNKVVNYLNGVVREFKFGTDVEPYITGDKLIANKPLFIKQINSNKYFSSVFYKIIGHTSDEYTIVSANIITKTFKEKVKTAPALNFTGTFWKLILQHDKGGNTIEVYVLHKNSKKDYIELLKDYHAAAKKARNKDYWITYYNAQKWIANLSYNYAITVHKAQGSTYENVILIEEDINRNKDIEERNRLKYTAYTRVKDTIFILR